MVLTIQQLEPLWHYIMLVTERGLHNKQLLCLELGHILYYIKLMEDLKITFGQNWLYLHSLEGEGQKGPDNSHEMHPICPFWQKGKEGGKLTWSQTENLLCKC